MGLFTVNQAVTVTPGITTIYNTSMHCTQLQYTALCCAALHCTALDCTTLHCIALYYTDCKIVMWQSAAEHVFDRPDVAGAVLQTASLLIN